MKLTALSDTAWRYLQQSINTAQAKTLAEWLVSKFKTQPEQFWISAATLLQQNNFKPLGVVPVTLKEASQVQDKSRVVLVDNQPYVLLKQQEYLALYSDYVEGPCDILFLTQPDRYPRLYLGDGRLYQPGDCHPPIYWQKKYGPQFGLAARQYRMDGVHLNHAFCWKTHQIASWPAPVVEHLLNTYLEAPALLMQEYQACLNKRLSRQEEHCWTMFRHYLDKKDPRQAGRVFNYLSNLFPHAYELKDLMHLHQLYLQNNGQPFKIIPLSFPAAKHSFQPNRQVRLGGFHYLVLLCGESALYRNNTWWGPYTPENLPSCQEGDIRLHHDSPQLCIDF